MTPEVSQKLAEAGPWAVVLFIGGLAAITFVRAVLTLWNEHLKADQDDRDQRDRAMALLELAERGNEVAAEAGKANASAVASMAAAWAERNRMDAARQRRQDKP